jgi:hypothetical protein
MLRSLVTDFILIEVQCDEYLFEELGEQYKERTTMLLYFVAKH